MLYTLLAQFVTFLLIGNGPVEKAKDQIVVRRQKRRGMPWSVQASDALAA